MLRALIFALVIGVVSYVSGAPTTDDAPRRPKSVAGNKSLAKRDRAVEKAEAAFRKSRDDANKVLLAELKKAKDAALASKNLDEANAVAALITETEQALDAKPRKGVKFAVDLTEGEWIESGGSRGTYTKDGTVRFVNWREDGKWEAVGERTIVQREGSGHAATVTFTDDGRHALWVFTHGHVTWSRRAE